MRVASDVDSDLPELTEKELKFVMALLENKSAVEAFLFAYGDMKRNVAYVRASNLRRSDKVQAWISAGRKAYLGAAVVTIDTHVRELERLREIALESGNVGAAVQAEQLRGKASGLYVDKYENVTPPEPIRVLEAMARFDPGLAAQLAARFGVTLEAQDALPASKQIVELTVEDKLTD